MDRLDIKPAQILKAIRDDTANDFSTLDKTFAACSADRHLIREALGRLEQAKLVAFANGRYTITENWMRIKGILGVSLTSLLQTDAALQVKPYFGFPLTIPYVPDLFVLMPFTPQMRPVYDDHIIKVASMPWNTSSPSGWSSGCSARSTLSEWTKSSTPKVTSI